MRHSSILSGESSSCAVGGPIQQHGFPQHRPAASHDVTVTESTKFSSVSSLNNNNSPAGEECDVTPGKRRGGRRKLRSGGFARLCKLPSLVVSRRKSAERGDWDTVRKLISNYEFSDNISEVPTRKRQQPRAAAFRGQRTKLHGEPTATASSSSRRPSYGSRNGDRRSFTGKESAAAAAVIKASLLEESLESIESAAVIKASLLEESLESIESATATKGHGRPHRAPDVGENILHDVCRCRPPPDVVETLLEALRHRRGVASGTTHDDGARRRTPLHLAAECGASPEVIDALVRADPRPASMADADGRSPLHLAVRYLARERRDYERNTTDHHRHQHQHRASHKKNAVKACSQSPLAPEDALKRTYQSVLILKDAMLTHPGCVDFKDEDRTGFSPLDYAIDFGAAPDETMLLQSLIRRKEPRVGRCGCANPRSPSLNRRTNDMIRRRHSTQSSACDDQDIEILRMLERDEIEARRERMRKIKSRRRKETMDDALYDVFGIEEQSAAVVISPPAAGGPVCPAKLVDDIERQSKLEATESVSDEKVEVVPQANAALATMSEDAKYNRHLQDYLDNFMNDLEGCEDLEYDDEDGFDILVDPEEAMPVIDESAPRGGDDANMPPLSVIVVTADDHDCLSVVSEITV
eukprot:CAMPEP_0181137536 /NCGR_PEP_ID=MMETSP1071-20121207/33757_1 /TAXON_ID=35127 /ORGANISM="Thalassiosira sp., Strain NH16" /LENGTH=641 /DNA_ID=CAMNT_0023224295 /DNA_START=243 /DNA_END=2165 /DNA_ORIENTATION=+